MKTHYIPRHLLPNLKHYRYSGIDHSLLSRYVLQPYWSRLVLLFPDWIAPNLITLLGLSCIVVNIATLLYYDPTLDGACPNWVYYTWAAGLWIYSSLDAIDGKQARRTGTSGPLGQLFDHGCDALNVALGSLLASEAGHLGGSWWTVAGLCGAQLNFYVSTWEEYHTGTLYLSAFSGPVEGVVILTLMFAITGWKGPAYWDTGLGDMLHVAFLPQWPVKYVLFGLSQITVIINLALSFRNILLAIQSRPKDIPKDAPHHLLVNPAVHRVIGRVLPAFQIPMLLVLSIYLQPTLLHGRLLVPLILYVGFAASYFVGRMIVAHVTGMRFPRGNVILTPWIVYTALLLARNYATPLLDTSPLLSSLLLQITQDNVTESVWVLLSLVWGALVYGWFAYRVIQDICDYMDIWCLRIKYYNQPRPENKIIKRD